MLKFGKLRNFVYVPYTKVHLFPLMSAPMASIAIQLLMTLVLLTLLNSRVAYLLSVSCLHLDF
jgi:hypothetical protein